MLECLEKLERDMAVAIRQKIKTTPDFKEGSIRLRFMARSGSGKYYLGMKDHLEPQKAVEIVYTANDGYNHIRPAGWRGSDEPARDCHSRTAETIQAMDAYPDHILGGFRSTKTYFSENLADEYLIEGLFNKSGGICMFLCRKTNSNPWSDDYTTLLQISAAVDGATPEENKECVMAAYPVVDEWIKTINF